MSYQKVRAAYLSARVTPLEKIAIKRMAALEGVGQSDMVRLLIREGAERRTGKPIALMELAGEVQNGAT